MPAVPPLTAPDRRILWWIVPTALGVLLAAMVAFWQARERAIDVSVAEARAQLTLQADALMERIERHRALPRVLAVDPQIGRLLAAPALDEAQRAQLSARLERVNGAAATSTLTLLDRQGVAVAASNWRQSNSNIGQNYAFRPYFQQAMAQGSGWFYALGVTTGQAGLFLSQRVEDDAGAALGVVVIKLVLTDLEASWATLADRLLLSDAHDVVFLSANPGWRYSSLRPLADEEQLELARARQYGREQVSPLLLPQRQTLREGVERVQLPGQGRQLWVRMALPIDGWTLHLLRSTAGINAVARQAAALTAALLLALGVSALYWRQRRRLARLRERSRLELERLVTQHAAEMRSAQTALVEAARGADVGESRALAHLPQGVCVVDAELRLLAWNKRYVELFRFPSGFVAVGRPIEDVLRYNARRGLLGNEPEDEVVVRRLSHLRSGMAHRYERERADGSVIEIHGNPLPDGGYVTSYADITSYRNAARELRSLADALQQRIDDRTRDLDLARQAAEQANRSKTRLVAAAVHDLLQPLNAARLFLSALQERQADAEGRQLAAAVDEALAAQSGILTSLLDIARLESGALDTQIVDFELDPLLSALAAEFGALAAARGLTLRAYRSRAVVRCDPLLLRRILQNLLSNAVRYTRRGRIVLGCRRDGERLRIEVHDSGPGIPPSRQQEIFEEFRRLDDDAAGAGGAGLGLAIVERMTRLLELPLRLRSIPGRGSVFAVSLQLGDPALLQAPPPPPLPPTDDDDGLRGLSVWCIDDDPRICQAMRERLERWQCRVAVSGGAGAARAAVGAGEIPELVLLDVHLGGDHADASGPALLDTLASAWARQPTVIVITAEHDAELRRRIHERGWGLLLKPVQPAALRSLMRQLLLARGRR